MGYFPHLSSLSLGNWLLFHLSVFLPQLSLMTDIFISYSHKDEPWKDALERHLKVLELHGEFAIWDDRQIEMGSNWLPAIETALEKARVALLLVSSDFLTSEFIKRKEIPRFLQRREAEGLQIIPVMVKPCLWQAVPWLEAIQGATKDNRPLSQYALGSHESEVAFAEIAFKVYQRLQASKQAEAAKQQAEQQRLAQEQAEREAAAKQQAEQTRLQQEAEERRLAQQQAGRAAAEQARQAELQRQREAQAERERLARQQAEAAERAQAEQLKREQAAAAKAETERLVREARELNKNNGGSGSKAKWLLGGVGVSALVLVWVMQGKKPEVVVPTLPDSTVPSGEPAKPTIPLPEMLPIKGGTFTMGCKDGRDDVEGGCQDDEKPPHSVTVSDFALSRTEITRGQFRAFLDATGYKTTAEEQGSCWGDKTGKGDWDYVKGNHWQKVGFEQTDDHPVVCVSWEDAQAYVQWLNQVDTGKNYQLPSEAEWEYAARGGNQKNAYPWGQDGSGQLACQRANLADQVLKKHYPNWLWTLANCDDGYVYTAPTGQFDSNGYGLKDMHGNVWEWTQDCYHASYDKAPKDASAWQENNCEKRVMRGGSWFNDPQFARSAIRFRNLPAGRDNDIGFRISGTY
ncbi:SUMF1/EgtB/PvdO family nonheme iron enzyme [uncultured Thiothrix sp.]|uniref:SUMF1/EgtB/PvdO family nonheme iron enzyme n=1 Tax=uncultured Thiothrix sp. TaxID=223185 RepID=UPI002632D6D6|nr:SUMF1/EgtB/PvdO family nonheme iron enzyme [uncultured Thiothrix sp.]